MTDATLPALFRVVPRADDPALSGRRGVESSRTLEMAEAHTNRALQALERLPSPQCSHAETCRVALVDVAHRVLNRTK